MVAGTYVVYFWVFTLATGGTVQDASGAIPFVEQLARQAVRAQARDAELDPALERVARSRGAADRRSLRGLAGVHGQRERVHGPRASGPVSGRGAGREPDDELGAAGGSPPTAAVLVVPLEGSPPIDPFWLTVLIGAAITWAIGSVYSRRVPAPRSPFHAAGLQMLAGGTFEGKRIVSERGFNDIVRKEMPVGGDLPFDASYGLGWLISDRNGHPLISHAGGVPGFNAMVEVVPDQRLGFVVLVNAASPLDEVITDLVLDIMVGKSESPTASAGSAPQGEPAKNAATAAAAPSAIVDITLDELTAKVIAAAGGEASLRRHRSTTGTATLDFENQGVTGKVVMYAQAPNSATQITTFTALSKTIASSREYFDGTQAGYELFGGSRRVADLRYKDEWLESTRISSDYYELLNWKTLYKTVTISQSKVADEDVYIVVKTPEKGNACRTDPGARRKRSSGN